MRRRSRLIIILLLVLTAAVIVYALFFMGWDAETTEVYLPTPNREDGAGSTAAPGFTLSELTPGNVQAALAELSRAESYSRTVTVEDFWGSGSAESQLMVWVSGEKALIRGSMGGSTRNLLLLDGMLYVWYDSISGLRELEYSDGADAWLRCITYEDVLELDSELISAAGYQQYAGADCIYVEYSEGDEDYVNRIYVSVDTGLLMGAETRSSGELIYRMQSTLPELTAPDESLFTPPER